jgi:hypothetical protein
MFHLLYMTDAALFIQYSSVQDPEIVLTYTDLQH